MTLRSVIYFTRLRTISTGILSAGDVKSNWSSDWVKNGSLKAMKSGR